MGWASTSAHASRLRTNEMPRDRLNPIRCKTSEMLWRSTNLAKMSAGFSVAWTHPSFGRLSPTTNCNGAPPPSTDKHAQESANLGRGACEDRLDDTTNYLGIIAHLKVMVGKPLSWTPPPLKRKRRQLGETPHMGDGVTLSR